MIVGKRYARDRAGRRAVDLEYAKMQHQARLNAEAMAEVAQRMKALP
jgi:hypothetical protein